MQFLWKYIEDLVGKGLDSITVGKLIFYMSATMVPLALPLAILLSAIMAFGNMGENFELVALKSAGISLTRFMRPLFIVCLFLSGGAFLFANYVIPVANLQAKSLLYDIVNLKHGFNIQPGIFFTEISDMAIKVDSKEPDGKTIHGVMIYDKRDPDNKKLILAKDGKMETAEAKRYVNVFLHNGYEYEERGRRLKDKEIMKTHFEDFKMILDLSDFQLSRTPVNLFSSNYQMQNVVQLSNSIDSIKQAQKKKAQKVHVEVTSNYPFTRWQKDSSWELQSLPPPQEASFDSLIPERHKRYAYQSALSEIKRTINKLKLTLPIYKNQEENIIKHKIEWQRKFTLSFACLVLFLIGAPLGSIIRKGGLGAPLVFAVAFFVIFYIVSTIGEQLSEKYVLTPFAGMWLATAVLLPIAGFLIYKALNDSQMFNKEFYHRIVKSIRKFFVHK